MPRRLIAVLLFALPAATQAGPAPRLPRDVRPESQSIALTLDPRRADYTGSVQAELVVERPVRSFALHGERLSVDRLTLSRAGEAVEVGHTASDNLIHVQAAADLAPGRYRLEIAFHNRFDTQAAGLYRLETGGESYAFTQLESDDARLAFPCWDEPSFKIPYQLTLTVPKGQVAVSNTPIASEHTDGDWTTVEFARTRPLPSYLLAIAVGPLEAVPIPGLSVPGRVLTPKGASGLAGEAVRVTPPLLAELERWFGRPYPYEKLDLIAVPEFWPGAMENPGAITYADRVLLIDPRSATREQRRRLITITSHELAHMWFGDLVTMAWWDDLWLNESFASWMGDKAADRVFPELEIAARSVRDAQGAMEVDALPSARAIRQPVAAADNLLQIADALAYDKGQSVLGMTEAWVGPEAFRKGVLDYLERHAWGNATAADLWGALGRASGRDVAAVLTSFLDQGGVPLVSVEPLPDGRVRLSQSRFVAAGVRADAALWRIPVSLDYPVAGGTRRHTVLLTQASEVVSLPGATGPLAWVHPNADEIGYYRWRLAPQQIEVLAGLPGRGLRERMGLVGNLTALLAAGVLHGDAHLRLLARAAADPHPDVVQAALDGIEHAQATFAFEAPLAGWATWVRNTLRPALSRIGDAPRSGEPEEVAPLRGRLLAWLADDGDDVEAREQGQRLARRFLADPGSVDPALVGPALRIAAASGDKVLFDTYRARFEAARSPAERGAFLSALGAFRDPELQQAALAYTLSGPLRPQEVGYVAYTASQTPGSRDRVVGWFLDNYDAIAAKIPAAYLAGAPRLGSGCSLARLARVERFFSDPQKAPPGVEKTLRSMSEASHACVALQQREGAAVAAFLAGQSGAGSAAAGSAPAAP